MREQRQASIKGKSSSNGQRLDIEEAVLHRYERAAKEAEVGLCVPVNYDPFLLKVIPEEVIQKDYGCGNPSQYVREGETVLDLGSGSGKACYIMSQVVGPRGRVIGVDFNEEMLTLVRKYQDLVGDKLGYHNVEFCRGRIQNLRIDSDLLDQHLASNPVRSASDLLRLYEFERKISDANPMIPDDFVDVIVSNCVLNMVRPEDKKELFSEP